jgi:hypothetical protein
MHHATRTIRRERWVKLETIKSADSTDHFIQIITRNREVITPRFMYRRPPQHVTHATNGFQGEKTEIVKRHISSSKAE